MLPERRKVLSLDCSVLKLVLKRLDAPIAPVEVPSSAAPVHQIVLRGADADFTKLPIHFQHAWLWTRLGHPAHRQ